ncbi:formyltetrahydrofolate deformylase [Deinococcus wulumuqiensis]|uniref:Formyltetrahydrofolate deformylase n=1 Tax=Deinococcus wulumuqiensis TaxID=980427 RepID=A0AAV4K735_9DEIO|nr:formyltetrahydrofolate deformylase [Deinococcus wulumuqiensis]QII19371.1 formyltetrahydrofolate deformylase [Deinococcus wulumuqiensis R12]GGI68503.1 formyltetrahydrofolate deformylase [Deinococcus wulumuqiensis]GGI77258.1 formyltetrahydrofolate deformylase [Deinococcus wulumuqiensis]
MSAPAPQFPQTATLTISCADRPGIVAAVSQFLHGQGANIVHSDQHSTDPSGGRFFMRMEFFLGGLEQSREAFERAFGETVARDFGMEWHLNLTSRPKKMAVLVSRYDHCLLDLLWRKRRGELNVEIPLILSNHEELRRDAEMFGIPFHVIPVTKDNKAQAEAEQVRLLREAGADFAVLARYMQILSGDFLRGFGRPVINIHHSFLPAFVGANPYRAAFNRGVKLIGATSHYVTEELDAGPIIAQDVVPVTHRETPDTLMRLGRDVERQVLARAVKAHVEDRVLVDGNKTVVF